MPFNERKDKEPSQQHFAMVMHTMSHPRQNFEKMLKILQKEIKIPELAHLKFVMGNLSKFKNYLDKIKEMRSEATKYFSVHTQDTDTYIDPMSSAYLDMREKCLRLQKNVTLACKRSASPTYSDIIPGCRDDSRTYSSRQNRTPRRQKSSSRESSIFEAPPHLRRHRERQQSDMMTCLHDLLQKNAEANFKIDVVFGKFNPKNYLSTEIFSGYQNWKKELQDRSNQI